MPSDDSGQDPEHAKRLKELKRAKELADAALGIDSS